VTLADEELQRARWRRTLYAFRMESSTPDDFAMGGLASRLSNVTTQVLLLPGDPERQAITFDDSFSAWLEANRTIDLGTTTVALPMTVRRTAHAIALVGSYGDEGWGSYFAIHRSGALEFGLGDRGGWQGGDGKGGQLSVIALTPTVARVWALLEASCKLTEKAALPGPFLLTVAVRQSGGSLLGALGEGWAEPGSFENRLGTCHDEHLLWHLELEELPEGDAAQAVAYSVGDRFEDAWGTNQRRYLAHRGDHQGHMDPRAAG
jgi:hypothetical protein